MHAHDHAVIGKDREHRLRIVIAANLFIVLLQVIFGLIAHSLGLLADAGHNFTDVAGVFLSLLAVGWAKSAPTPSRTYGLHRTAILAALGNAASILLVTMYIMYEGAQRLGNPQPVEGFVVVLVAGFGFIANALSALYLKEEGDDLNMRSAFLHMAADAAASIGVVISGATILVVGGLYWLDPVVAMAIAILIAIQAWRLFREAIHVLLEGAPAGINVDHVREHILATEGVLSVHDLHVWSVTSGMPMMSAHVVIERGASSRQLLDALHECLDEHFEIEHCTIQIERATPREKENLRH